jgi:hypothetical protein
MKFSEFLNEAPKKKKIDDWAADSREYETLSRMKHSFSSHYDIRPQLFVPKRRDPDVARRMETGRRVWAAYKDHQDSIKEEAPPVLTSYTESPPGDNKPGTAFWTSTAIKTEGGYTSDWYNFVKRTFPTWQTDYGYLFEVTGSPAIFELDYADEFFWWARNHGHVEEPDGYFKDNPDSFMRVKFPWHILSRHFDGVSHNGYNRDGFSYGWDVESIAWFNTKYLKYAGAVKLSHYSGDD